MTDSLNPRSLWRIPAGLVGLVLLTWLLTSMGDSTSKGPRPSSRQCSYKAKRHCKPHTAARQPSKESLSRERVEDRQGALYRTFHLFASLPPELRGQIWRDAMPAPGANIIRMSPVFERGAGNDVYRCTLHWDSPPAAQDYSVWQTRQILMATCREARAMTRPPADKSVKLRLTRPQRYTESDAGRLALFRTPWISRQILLHVDEMLVLEIQQGLDELNTAGEMYGQRWRPKVPGLPHLSGTMGISFDKVCIEYTEFQNTQYCSIDLLILQLRCQPTPYPLFRTITSRHPSTREIPKRFLAPGEGVYFRHMVTYYGALWQELVLFEVDSIRHLAGLPSSRVLVSPLYPCDLTAPAPWPVTEADLEDPREVWNSFVRQGEGWRYHSLLRPSIARSDLRHEVLGLIQ